MSFQVFDGDLPQAVADSYCQDSLLAVDTEAMGLYPRRDRLCVVQLCNAASQVSVLRIPQGWTHSPYLQQVLETQSVEKIFHYARFDLAMLKYHLNIQVTPTFCTKIASKLARTYTHRHGLKEVVLEMCGVELNKSAQSSDWGAVEQLTEDQLAYAANDVHYLIPVRERLITMLKREGRWDLAQHCFAHLPTLVELDLLGYSSVFEHQ